MIEMEQELIQESETEQLKAEIEQLKAENQKLEKKAFRRKNPIQIEGLSPKVKAETGEQAQEFIEQYASNKLNWLTTPKRRNEFQPDGVIKSHKLETGELSFYEVYLQDVRETKKVSENTEKVFTGKRITLKKLFDREE